MLKIECSNCKTWIHLPFNDTGETKCPGCGSANEVKDVFVSAGPFTIFREVLLKNSIKYKRLIIEAEKELKELEKKGDERAYEVSIRSIGTFLSNLKELLDGCRTSLRYKVKDCVARIEAINGTSCEGRIVNISLSGICIDGGKETGLARLWSDVKVTLKGDETQEFWLLGKVMWISPQGHLGIKFIDSAEEQRLLQEFILEKSSLTEMLK